MFTGIIEAIGIVRNIKKSGSNVEFTIESTLSSELKIDQSVAHNGVCLTVTSVQENTYIVTAIEETLLKSNLGDLQIGDATNLERSMLMNGRVDGHIVQGHVDQTGTCIQVQEKEGSWVFDFVYDTSFGNITVEKGSICVNGVSLTVVNSHKEGFSVAIIPYTFEHTNFKEIEKNTKVNLEFDILGKYVQKLIALQN